jgi:hypothetical protein
MSNIHDQILDINRINSAPAFLYLDSLLFYAVRTPDTFDAIPVQTHFSQNCKFSQPIKEKLVFNADLKEHLFIKDLTTYLDITLANSYSNISWNRIKRPHIIFPISYLNTSDSTSCRLMFDSVDYIHKIFLFIFTNYQHLVPCSKRKFFIDVPISPFYASFSSYVTGPQSRSRVHNTKRFKSQLSYFLVRQLNVISWSSGKFKIK